MAERSGPARPPEDGTLGAVRVERPPRRRRRHRRLRSTPRSRRRRGPGLGQDVDAEQRRLAPDGPCSSPSGSSPQHLLQLQLRPPLQPPAHLPLHRLVRACADRRPSTASATSTQVQKRYRSVARARSRPATQHKSTLTQFFKYSYERLMIAGGRGRACRAARRPGQSDDAGHPAVAGAEGPETHAQPCHAWRSV